jgi:hypothetical protein
VLLSDDGPDEPEPLDFEPDEPPSDDEPDGPPSDDEPDDPLSDEEVASFDLAAVDDSEAPERESVR